MTTTYAQPITTGPAHGALDKHTKAVLDAVADLKHPSVNYEMGVYLLGLGKAVDVDGLVYPNRLRPHTRGRIFHKRIGSFRRKVVSLGVADLVFEPDGRQVYQKSDDTEGRNSGRLMPVLRLNRAAWVAACAKYVSEMPPAEVAQLLGTTPESVVEATPEPEWDLESGALFA